jgi:hypothetical protein
MQFAPAQKLFAVLEQQHALGEILQVFDTGEHLHTHTHTHTHTHITYIYMYMYVYIYIYILSRLRRLRRLIAWVREEGDGAMASRQAKEVDSVMPYIHTHTHTHTHTCNLVGNTMASRQAKEIDGVMA